MEMQHLATTDERTVQKIATGEVGPQPKVRNKPRAHHRNKRVTEDQVHPLLMVYLQENKIEADRRQFLGTNTVIVWNPGVPRPKKVKG